MLDVGGQRSERTMWIPCFEGVTSIIFCAALSEYDQVLLEDPATNRMNESLFLFESIISSCWFFQTPIILFLNKIDIFKAKLSKVCSIILLVCFLLFADTHALVLQVPLENYFPDYMGGSDINQAAKYIRQRYTQANCTRLSVYPHLTEATDTRNIETVLAAVKETVLMNALKNSGIL